ncbi:hypothetical protein C8Q74DRAFT_1371604 [Fomes fomentarius]|nr:hypothetical protein C8Q74DRAFT_1371604 [Fomes fomentarius]
MDDEIEETQRQLRRSATLLQGAFEGLSTFNSRVSEASLIRRQGGSSVPVPRAPIPQHLTTVGPVPVEEGMSRRTMDPGHDVIVISSSDSAPIASTSTSPPSLPTSSAMSASPRWTRPSESTLVSLRSELLASTQSVRERASELEELRRSIVQYSQERNATPADAASPSIVETDPGVREAQGPSRRTLLDYSLRQRAASESTTSHGIMVAARSSSPPSDTGTMSTTNFAAAQSATASTGSNSLATATPSPLAEGARLLPPPVPTVIASRVTRLAQEIQQDIARITQQSESLMAWINDHRSRLDSSTRSSVLTHPPQQRGGASREPTAGPSIVRRLNVPVAPGNPPPTTSNSDTVTFSAPSLGITIGPFPRSAVSARSDATPTPRRRASETGNRPREQPTEGGSTSQSPTRPRRTPDVAVRARYLRQNVPSSWSMISPVAASPHEDRSPSWSAFPEPGQDGPLLLPMSTSHTAEAGTSTGSVFDDPDLLEATGRVRLAVARARAARRVAELEEDGGGGDVTEPRSYRVHRRYNADGDEEDVRIAPRPEMSPGLGETTGDRAREDSDDAEEEVEGGAEDQAWMQALSRLDALSRESAARDTVTNEEFGRARWDPPPAVRRRDTMRSGADAGATSSLARRTQRGAGWPRLSARGDPETSTEEDEYERNLAAMRARARSLINSSSSRILGGATLPPPPPTTRPLSFVPTTQGTPGSLWNDSNVRVRLRSMAQRLDEDMRLVLDAARERGDYYMSTIVPSPSPPLDRPRHDMNASGTAPANQHAADLERPTWGSPTPFRPSPLPLPLVEDVTSLEARSRVFGGAKKYVRMPRRKVLAQAGR